MMTGRGHVLDVSDVTARLVLSNSVSRRDVAMIRRRCRRIPERVRTLHLDLAAVTRFEDGVLSAVRGVVRDWRRSRQGDCRLDYTSPLLVARVQDHRLATTPDASAPTAAVRQEPTDFVSRRPSLRHDVGCGEPDPIAPS